MITLDALRTAVLSTQPWTELDKLVRAELATGRLTRAVYDEIRTLQEAVRETPGYGEDADDAIGDTLDALIGLCRTDRAYKNPPVLPTEEEIAKLPRWGRVAFAARCARRVLPIALNGWPSHNRDYSDALADCVHYSEKVAEYAERRPDFDPIETALTAYSHAAHVVGMPQPLVFAVSAVCSAVNYAQIFDELGSTNHNLYASSTEAVAAGQHLFNLRPNIRRDFDHLARLAEWQKWTDETPVPPEVFGPLWPEGPPKGWPPITDVPPRGDLALALFARARTTEQMIEDDVVNLFNALNSYHIARSGVRLTLEQFRSLIPALVPAEV